MDSLTVFCDKLDSQQPLFQRIAVKSIFDKLRSSPALAESAPGQEALMQCISSPHKSVVDQSVHEVCGLARAQVITLGQAMNYLQTALDSAADASTVQIVVTGIGFLCRIAVSRATTVADAAKAFTVHPLVKAVNSRDEASGELLQQVRLILLQPARGEQERALGFIKPFLAHVFVESSQLTFARQLHTSLCSLAASNHVSGSRLFDTLLQLVQHRSLLSSQDLETVCAALQELVDVLDILADSMEQSSGAVKRLLDVLFCFYEDTRKRNLSSLRVLSLIRRASAIALHILQPQELDSYLLLLAHRLVDSQHELEQLSILSLVLSWLQQDGNNFEGDRVLFLLSWVFPVLYVLSFPSTALREPAFKLLGIVENVYMSFQVKSRSSVAEVPEVRQTLLFKLWWQEPLNTWASASGTSAVGWLAKVDDLVTRNFTQVISNGFPFQLLILLTSLMFHSTTTIAVSAIRIIALLGKKEPAWGMLLFPVLLFALKICMRQSRRAEIVALLHALPDVSSHSTSLAFSMNFFQAMVDYKLDLVIPSTSVRLLYKLWENTDRSFPYLQRILQPSNFSKVGTEENDLLLSRAVSLRDLCKHDSERGIDLVLSVQACIESKSNLVQALGLQSLSFMCDDDAVDFYTAWKVVSKFALPVKHHSVAESLCMLLKHGAAEASSHPEEAAGVLRQLWVFSSLNQDTDDFWWKTRSAALIALNAYEVEVLKTAMNSDHEHVTVLLAERNPTARRDSKALVVKFLVFEHSTRQRARSTQTIKTKLGKLLEEIPRTFHSALLKNAGVFIAESPGASLLFWRPGSPPATATSKKAVEKALRNEVEDFRRFFSDAVESMEASSDLITALLSTQSWSRFFPNWLEAELRLHGNIQKAEESVMKICTTVIEEGNPRVAENAILALAALSKSSSEGLAASICKYLQSLMALGHEQAHWCTALSLGIATTSLHITDWSLQTATVELLLEYATKSHSGMSVAGAVLAMGSVCQTLYLSSQPKGSKVDRESKLFSDILLCLLHLLPQLCPLSSSTTQKLLRSGRLGEMTRCFNMNSAKSTASDIETLWAVIATVHSLGVAAVAAGRAGNIQMVRDISEAIVSWLPESYEQSTDLDVLSLAAGASLAVPEALNACYKLELLENETVISVLKRLQVLIQHTLGLSQSSRSSYSCALHAFRAGCVGAGAYLASILQTGAYPLGADTVSCLLDLFRRGCSEMQSPQGCFGAMLGFANALGAGSGLLTAHRTQVTSKEGFEVNNKFVTRPLLLDGAIEDLLRSMLQQIAGLSHSSADSRLRSYARWSLGFMNDTWLRMSENNEEHTDQAKPTYQPVAISSLPGDSTLRLLCEWLTSIGVGRANVPCSAALSVLECLEAAPRLPSLDWAGLLRRLMKHSEWFSEVTSSGYNHADIRKSCISFSLRHAGSVPAIASLLDELYDSSRLRVLELPLQMFMLEHLADLRRGFSLSRMQRLLNDLVEMLEGAQMEFRIHCWKGLRGLLTSNDDELLLLVEDFGMQLVSGLPSQCSSMDEECKGAIECLKAAKPDWLLETFQVNNVSQEDIRKTAFARSKLVTAGTLPLSALQPLRSWMLNQTIEGNWELLVEVVLALKQGPVQLRKQWLFDTLDAASASNHPATAVHFLALLVSSWSPRSYLLACDPASVVTDLPGCLSSLVMEPAWAPSTPKVAAKVFQLALNVKDGLREVLQSSAIALREHAPVEMRLRML